MKKITLVIMAFLVGSAIFAQSTSFEQSEGFVLGNLGGQNGWTVFGATPTIPQVSNAQASDGTYGLHLIASDGQANAGAFSPLFASNLDAVIAVDIFLPSTGGASGLSDIDFLAQSPSQALLTSRVKFSFDDTIQILDDSALPLGFVDSGATVTRDAWFELKIAYRFSTGDILYYIDGSLIYSGNVFGGTNVEQMIAIFDNYGSDAYFDNIVYTDGTVLATQEFEANSISHKYNSATDLLTLESSSVAFDQITIYNLLGQQVISRGLSQTSEMIDLSNLQDAVYIVKVANEGNSSSFKLLKQ